MMKEVIEIILKAFSELTLRRFISLILILFMFAIGFMGYERFTSSFSLARIQKSVELLTNIEELRSRDLDPESKALCDILLEQLQKAVAANPLSIRIVSEPFIVRTVIFWKFLFGGAVWFCFALFSLPKTLRGNTESRNFLYGFVVAGCAFGIVGIIVPAIWWPYFHLFVYPFIISIIIIAISVMAQKCYAARNSKTCPPKM